MSAINLPVASAPHAHDHSSVNRIMLQVCLALFPCTIFGFYLFGWPSVYLFVITVTTAIMWEAICLKLMNQPVSRLRDSSALLTGWLLALSLPPWSPWWMGVGGSFVAIVIGKQLFGGLGYNLFNPAMLARAALLISFPVQMTTWISPGLDIAYPTAMEGLLITFWPAAEPLATDAYTGATLLSHIKTQLSTGVTATATLNESFDATRSFLGQTSGSLGETSALLVALGGIYLLFKRVISWHIPMAMLLTVGGLSAALNGINPDLYAPASVHLLSGGVMLGAFFIATDMVTSPTTRSGQLIFGFGCGLLTYVIRTWGNFPEGVGFAVLFMNSLTPLIDLYFKPKAYGRTLTGAPKPPLVANKSALNKEQKSS